MTNRFKQGDRVKLAGRDNIIGTVRTDTGAAHVAVAWDHDDGWTSYPLRSSILAHRRSVPKAFQPHAVGALKAGSR